MPIGIAQLLDALIGIRQESIVHIGIAGNFSGVCIHAIPLGRPYFIKAYALSFYHTTYIHLLAGVFRIPHKEAIGTVAGQCVEWQLLGKAAHMEIVGTHFE